MWFHGHRGTLEIHHAVLGMTDSSNSGGSVLGVYGTEGNLNHAPDKDCGVLVSYEHRALQQNFSRLTGSDPSMYMNAELKYIPDTCICTTLGTGGSPLFGESHEYYRDCISNIKPYTYNQKSESFGIDADLSFTTQYTVDSYNTFKDYVPYTFSGGSSKSIAKTGDFAYAASLDMKSFFALDWLYYDSSYGPFGTHKVPVAINNTEGEFANYLLMGVASYQRGLFATVAISSGEEATLYRGMMFNLIGDPIIR